MTNEEYKKYTERHAPRSLVGKNLLWAFLIGGLICCLGQFLMNLYLSLGLDEESAATAESISLVFLGALLTGLGLYDTIARRAGAGTLVPITGFANSVVAPALEFKTEGFITGTAAKMFVIAGPVIVYGASAGVVYGLLLLLLRIV
jgi:stage V sporulation protein AC